MLELEVCSSAEKMERWKKGLIYAEAGYSEGSGSSYPAHGSGCFKGSLKKKCDKKRKRWEKTENVIVKKFRKIKKLEIFR